MFQSGQNGCNWNKTWRGSLDIDTGVLYVFIGFFPFEEF